MKLSFNWQITWITQRLHATQPLVPYPPQTMYPLREWMDGVRWLRDNTRRTDVVLAQITAGNFIPAYSGNTVYFGQANTVNYEIKQLHVNNFFQGEMNSVTAKPFLTQGGINYIFYSIQEQESAKDHQLLEFYPFLKPVYKNSIVTIFATH